MGTRLHGTGASDGLFMGPARRLGRAGERQPTGSPETERGALLSALAAAAEDLSGLIAKVEGEARDMLAFQLAMLEDDALSAPALMAVASGAAAHVAWADALDAEIAGYEAAEDAYFRARAADLKDIRDRVLRHLSGVSGEHAQPGSVLVAEDIGPTAFLEHDWSQGGAIALSRGSTTSHVAMLARARGIPMVVGLGNAMASAATLIVDGGTARWCWTPMTLTGKTMQPAMRRTWRRPRPASTSASSPRGANPASASKFSSTSPALKNSITSTPIPATASA